MLRHLSAGLTVLPRKVLVLVYNIQVEATVLYGMAVAVGIVGQLQHVHARPNGIVLHHKCAGRVLRDRLLSAKEIWLHCGRAGCSTAGQACAIHA